MADLFLEKFVSANVNFYEVTSLPRSTQTTKSCIFRVYLFRPTKSPLISTKNEHQKTNETRSNALKHFPPPGGTAQLKEAEERIHLLKSTPWKNQDGYRKQQSFEVLLKSKTQSVPRNTFGTSHKLRPINETSYDTSMESLPPPPSPKTLRRVMSFS